MRSDQPFQKLIYSICYSQLSITFAVFDMFVCISFMCLRVHVDLTQPLAARNNKRCSVLLTDTQTMEHRQQQDESYAMQPKRQR